MSDNAVSAAGSQEQALQSLLRAIASRNRHTTAQLLAHSPLLARRAMNSGAGN